MSRTIEVGEAAPDFTLQDYDGRQVRLRDFKGKKNVLMVFYCKDSTSG